MMASVFYLVIAWILLLNFNILKYIVLNTDLEHSAKELEKVDPLIERILIILMYCLHLFLRVPVKKGRSLGKFGSGTGGEKTDGSELIMSNYF